MTLIAQRVQIDTVKLTVLKLDTTEPLAGPAISWIFSTCPRIFSSYRLKAVR